MLDISTILLGLLGETFVPPLDGLRNSEIASCVARIG